jgi:hypothetical protein
VNPPKEIKLHDAIILYENKDAILLAVERMKAALVNAWEQIEKPFLRLNVEILKAITETEEKEWTAEQCSYSSNAWQQIRQKVLEREAIKFESDFNI